jgi:cytochrome b6-f complex iron-sulfur subunit
VTETQPGEGTRRRSFIRWFFGTAVGAFLVAVFYPVTRYIIPPAAAESSSSSVTLGIKPSDLEPNSAEIFKFGNRAGILLRTPSGELRAFSAVCTHLSCIVQYRPDISQIWCACHNGHFDLNGHNVSGPPPAPLEAYTVNVREDEIVVSRG